MTFKLIKSLYFFSIEYVSYSSMKDLCINSDTFGPVCYNTYAGYSFWDRLCNFLHNFTQSVLSVLKLGKFWEIYGQLLNIMSSYGCYEKSLQRSHNYQPVLSSHK